ncbi:MAG: bifunctional DNA primase/polymerase, partial [Pirellulales bacterium]|nr:bifunctional DNA primase/polymerase [Pirellulales bacterium]
HYIFRQPAGKAWRNTTSRLAPNVDTRADGGYIIAPPSVRADGVYRWAEGMALDVSCEHLPEPPAWLVAELDRLAQCPATSAMSRRVAASVGEGNSIPSGQRNATLASLAGTMRRAGMGLAEIQAALRASNLRCLPPLAEAEVERIATNIARYAPDEITVAVVENHWAQMTGDEDPEPSDSPTDPGPFPKQLLAVPGFIGQVIEHTVATSFRPQPVLALGAAIALMGTLVGRKVRDEVNTRTNVYCLGVCPSGQGKERAREVNKEILFLAGMEKLAGPEGLASHAGLVSAVEMQPSILLQLDEIGRLLKTLGDASRSPHLYHVVTVLMKLYTSSGSIYLGDAYADTKRNKAIDQPNACIWGTSVPKSLYEGLTYDSVTDGFLSRMLVFEGENHVEKQRPAMMTISQSLVETARWWGDYQPGGNLRDEHPEPRVVPITPEADEMLEQLDRWSDRQAVALGEPLGTLWTRTTEKARKLTLIHACSADPQSPTIDLAAAKWACAMSDYLTQRMIYLAHQWVAESPFDAKRKRVLRVIRDVGSEGITRTALCRRTRAMQSRERIEIIDALVGCGDVAVINEETCGAPRVRYVAKQ